MGRLTSLSFFSNGSRFDNGRLGLGNFGLEISDFSDFPKSAFSFLHLKDKKSKSCSREDLGKDLF